MAFEIKVMPSAEADLADYFDYIAADSRRRAEDWFFAAWEKILSLNENPNRFAVIPESEELGLDLRHIIHYSHRIVFRVKETEGSVEVIRVYHGARKPLTPPDLAE